MKITCNKSKVRASRDNESAWEHLRTKSVMDSDGFYTEYSLYKKRGEEYYICVFGDRDFYPPDYGTADAEFDSLEEAEEWFDSYNGFADDEDLMCSVKIDAGWFADKHRRASEVRTRDDLDSLMDDLVKTNQKRWGQYSQLMTDDPDSPAHVGRKISEGLEKMWRDTHAVTSSAIQAAKKRVAREGEFDNGKVLRAWNNWTSEEAEERARLMSIEHPEDVFYVAYDNVMNPMSEIRWKAGERVPVTSSLEMDEECEDYPEEVYELIQEMRDNGVGIFDQNEVLEYLGANLGYDREDSASTAQVISEILSDPETAAYHRYFMTGDSSHLEGFPNLKKFFGSSQQVTASRIDNVESGYEELHDELYGAGSEVMQGPGYGWPADEIPDSLFVDIMPDGDQIRIEVRAELSYEYMEGLAKELDKVIQKKYPDAYFDMEEPGIMSAYIQPKAIKSASYGGAYDIADDQYFTRDDLNEFDEAIEARVNEHSKQHWQIYDSFIEQNILFVQLTSEEGYDCSGEVRIDMRRIRVPSDLVKRYLEPMFEKLQPQIDEADSFITSSTDIEAGIYDGPERSLEPPYEAEPEELPPVKEVISIKLENVPIVMKSDGTWDYEDKKLNFASEDGKGGQWVYYDYPQVEVDDITSIVEKMDEMMAPYLPMRAGRYLLSGEVQLIYQLEGVESYGASGPDEDDEVNTEYATSEFLPLESKIVELQYTESRG